MTPPGRVDLTGLRERAQAATPGPWRPEVSEAEADEAFVVGQRPSGLHIVSDHCDIPDAFFIAAVSPDVVLALVEAVEAAQDYNFGAHRPGDMGPYRRLQAALVPFAAAEGGAE